MVVDLFRIENGKLVEHWDVLQTEVPVTAALGGKSQAVEGTAARGQGRLGMRRDWQERSGRRQAGSHECSARRPHPLLSMALNQICSRAVLNLRAKHR